MAKPGVTVISSFSYRGNTEEISNTFNFTGSAPSDNTGWDALCAAFITKLKPMLTDVVTIKRIYCYDDTTHDSVYTYDLASHGGTVVGTAVVSSGFQVPGDAAYWARWTTGRTSSKGKPVYLRKYFHGAFAATGAPDQLDSGIHSGVATAAAAIAASSGAWPGMAGPTYDLSSPVASVSTYLTTRTLKRRGKRP